MIEQPTAVHNAIAGLEQLADSALEDVQVVDGPRGALELERDVLIVGENGEGGPGFILERGDPDYGGRVEETGNIICLISAWIGDDDMKKCRARAVEIWGLLDMALRENPTLDGAVDDAMLGKDAQGIQVKPKSGTVCALGFTVRYKAWI